MTLCFTSSQEEFGDLFRHGGHERQTKHHAPFTTGQEMGVEDRLQERHSAHDQQQGDRNSHRVLHIFVREDTNRKQRSALRADGVGTEQFSKRQGDESHRLGGLDIHAAPVMREDKGQHIRTRRDDCSCFEMPDQPITKRPTQRSFA